jgi:hypothetical protein
MDATTPPKLSTGGRNDGPSTARLRNGHAVAIKPAAAVVLAVVEMKRRRFMTVRPEKISVWDLFDFILILSF